MLNLKNIKNILYTTYYFDNRGYVITYAILYYIKRTYRLVKIICNYVIIMIIMYFILLQCHYKYYCDCKNLILRLKKMYVNLTIVQHIIFIIH